MVVHPSQAVPISAECLKSVHSGLKNEFLNPTNGDTEKAFTPYNVMGVQVEK